MTVRGRAMLLGMALSAGPRGHVALARAVELPDAAPMATLAWALRTDDRPGPAVVNAYARAYAQAVLP